MKQNKLIDKKKISDKPSRSWDFEPRLQGRPSTSWTSPRSRIINILWCRERPETKLVLQHRRQPADHFRERHLHHKVQGTFPATNDNMLIFDGVLSSRGTSSLQLGSRGKINETIKRSLMAPQWLMAFPFLPVWAQTNTVVSTKRCVPPPPPPRLLVCLCEWMFCDSACFREDSGFTAGIQLPGSQTLEAMTTIRLSHRLLRRETNPNLSISYKSSNHSPKITKWSNHTEVEQWAKGQEWHRAFTKPHTWELKCKEWI